MANRHMKRCSTSLIIKEMQITTIMRYNLSPIRMAIIINQQTTNASEDVEKGELVHPFWKSVWRYLKKLKMDLTFDSEIPLLGIHLNESKTLIQKSISTPMFIATLFTKAKI